MVFFRPTLPEPRREVMGRLYSFVTIPFILLAFLFEKAVLLKGEINRG